LRQQSIGRHHLSGTGNDDATRAIALYCDLFAGAVLDGLQQEAIISGKDIGEQEEVPAEALAEVPAPAETPAPAEPPAAEAGAPA
jgi:small subunit ribosomal protein S2